MIEKLMLSDGNSIPLVGMGTWKITDAAIMDDAVAAALEVGYRHFDTAISYENEGLLGAALKKALPLYGLKREDVFITSKVPPWQMGREGAEEAVKASLEALDTPYLDLMLVHWPTSIAGEAGEVGRADTWRALEEAQAAGLVRSIGVSNFTERHLEQLLGKAKVKPAVNQIEIHPLYQDESAIKACQLHGIALIAYAPLATYDEKLVKNERVLALCAKYGKSPGQVALRWGIDRGWAVIPKASSKDHLLSNISIGDFSLAPEEVASLSELNIMFKTDWDPKDEP